MLNTGLIFGLLSVFTITYLLGSVNFAVVVSKLMFKDDARNYGSGNAGMTNMLRIYGKIPAVLTGVGDFLKGVVSVLIGRMLFDYFGVLGIDGGYVGAVGVLLGHLYPIYFRFKGGKGILTICGAILLMNPTAFLILLVFFVPIAFITRIVSLASVLGALCFPFLTYLTRTMAGEPYKADVVFSVICAGIILYMHRENISRLLKGTEKKIGQGKSEKQ